MSDAYKEAKEAGTLAVPTSEVLKPVIDFLWPLVDDLYLNIGAMVTPAPRLKAIPFNKANFDKKEFQELWGRINHKAVYQVDFDSNELIAKCVAALDSQLKVTQMQYVVQVGNQKDTLDVDDLSSGAGFTVTSTSTQLETEDGVVPGEVRPDRGDHREDTVDSADSEPDLAEGPAGDLREVPAEPGAVHHRVRAADQ